MRGSEKGTEDDEVDQGVGIGEDLAAGIGTEDAAQVEIEKGTEIADVASGVEAETG